MLRVWGSWSVFWQWPNLRSPVLDRGRGHGVLCKGWFWRVQCGKTIEFWDPSDTGRDHHGENGKDLEVPLLIISHVYQYAACTFQKNRMGEMSNQKKTTPQQTKNFSTPAEVTWEKWRKIGKMDWEENSVVGHSRESPRTDFRQRMLP